MVNPLLLFCTGPARAEGHLSKSVHCQLAPCKITTHTSNEEKCWLVEDVHMGGRSTSMRGQNVSRGPDTAGSAAVAGYSRASGQVFARGSGPDSPHPHDAHVPQPASPLGGQFHHLHARDSAHLIGHAFCRTALGMSYVDASPSQAAIERVAMQHGIQTSSLRPCPARDTPVTQWQSSHMALMCIPCSSG